MTEKSLDPFYHLIESNWINTDTWPDFVSAMCLAFPGDHFLSDPDEDPARWARLPMLCCQAAGGDPRAAEDVAIAWFFFYAAAHVFDALEDRDQLEPGLADLGPGAVLNVASGLLFSGSLALNRLHLSPKTHKSAAVIESLFYNCLLRMGSGQHRDLTQAQFTLDDWLEIAGAKSGSFFSLACKAGAHIAITSSKKLNGYGGFGYCLGMLIQILDDLDDLRQLDDAARLLPASFSRSLPVAYARSVLPVQKVNHLQESIKQAEQDLYSAQESLEIIRQNGAELYLRTEIERQRVNAQSALEQAAPEPSAGEKLQALLDNLSLT